MDEPKATGPSASDPTFMALKPILRGLATYLPIARRFTNRGSGGTDSVRYCYSVWLRHLVSLQAAGLGSGWPVVAELGPGDSLGTGIAALLSGVDRYFAFDVKPYFDNQTNLDMLDRLVELFERREPIPDESEFPGVIPRLTDYSFPEKAIPPDRLKAALAADRVAAIRNELTRLTNRVPGYHVSYFAPWDASTVVQPQSVDLAFSQAVMEHVVDVDATYRALATWLKPGGCLSHAIDFRSHQTAAEWNGHWGYSDLVWKIIVGRRAFLINREPHSGHLQALHNNGFEVRLDQCIRERTGLGRRHVAPRFRNLTDDDLLISGTFIVAQKGEHAGSDMDGH
jgi:SAM-dependent methyltransferase